MFVIKLKQTNKIVTVEKDNTCPCFCEQQVPTVLLILDKTYTNLFFILLSKHFTKIF